MTEAGTYHYGVVNGEDGWVFTPPDDCGYRGQADRIEDYQAQHTPESVIRFYSDQFHPDAHPDGCGVCGKATWWESLDLPNGQRQTRCTECLDTLTLG